MKFYKILNASLLRKNKIKKGDTCKNIEAGQFNKSVSDFFMKDLAPDTILDSMAMVAELTLSDRELEISKDHPDTIIQVELNLFPLWEIKTFKMLIEAGIDIHINNEIFIREAVINKKNNILEYLLDQEADIKKYSILLLKMSICTNNADAIRIFDKRKINVHKDSQLHLDYALEHSFFDVAEYYLDNMSDVCFSNPKIVESIIASDRYDILIRLINKENPVSTYTIFNYLSQHKSCLSMLKKILSDPNLLKPEVRAVLIKIIVEENNYEAIDFWFNLETEKEPEERIGDIYQFTLDEILIRAALNGNFHLVKRFLDEGANINYCDKKGRTALTESSQKCHWKVAKYLVSRGADIHAGNEKYLMNAILNNEFRLADSLLKLGSDIHVGNDIITRTAVQKELVNPLRYLISRGVDENLISDCKKASQGISLDE